MEDSKDLRYASRIVVSVFAAIAAVYLIYFLPLPLFIFSAGTAEVTRPMVQVKEDTYEEKGALMLTTVRVSDASIFSYLLSFVRPYDELHKKSELLNQGESEQEYTQRQEVNMLSSQSDAIQAAYHKLGIPYHISHDGVVVIQVFKDFPAAEVLEPGDYIVKVDDMEVQDSTDLQKMLKDKKAGDAVNVVYKRKNVTRTASVSLAALPANEGAKPEERKIGLGITLANMQSVRADDAAKQVSIQAGEIGGPSAGLIFSLEIMNKLTAEDMTRGYNIAGTGTIDAKGNVGVIGGIQHKVIAADKAGAEIFFAPRDYKAPTGQRINNYTDALQRGNEIHTKMKIVPVGTLDEALQYLQTLPPKGA